jgi:hypothetical protein
MLERCNAANNGEKSMMRFTFRAQMPRLKFAMEISPFVKGRSESTARRRGVGSLIADPAKNGGRLSTVLNDSGVHSVIRVNAESPFSSQVFTI